MSEHWNSGFSGKGSKPRPFEVPFEEFSDNHNRIFGERKKFCSKCGKTFSWCKCENISNTEDCLNNINK
jgi:hypothetical protein